MSDHGEWALKHMMEITERVQTLTGGSATTLMEGLEQWEREQQALSEFADENQALGIYVIRMEKLIQEGLDLHNKIMQEIPLLVPAHIRERLEDFEQQYNDHAAGYDEAKRLAESRRKCPECGSDIAVCMMGHYVGPAEKRKADDEK